MSIENSLLAVIAVSVAVMAAAQLVAALKMAKAADRLTQIADEFRRDAAPVLQSAREAAQMAAEVATIVKLQQERFDHFVLRTTDRVEDVVAVVHGLIVGPVSKGAAIVSGIQAIWETFSRGRQSNARAESAERPGDDRG